MGRGSYQGPTRQFNATYQSMTIPELEERRIYTQVDADTNEEECLWVQEPGPELPPFDGPLLGEIWEVT